MIPTVAIFGGFPTLSPVNSNSRASLRDNPTVPQSASAASIDPEIAVTIVLASDKSHSWGNPGTVQRCPGVFGSQPSCSQLTSPRTDQCNGRTLRFGMFDRLGWGVNPCRINWSSTILFSTTTAFFVPASKSLQINYQPVLDRGTPHCGLWIECFPDPYNQTILVLSKAGLGPARQLRENEKDKPTRRVNRRSGVEPLETVVVDPTAKCVRPVI